MNVKNKIETFKKFKLLLIVSISFMLFVTMRVSWMDYFSVTQKTSVEQGVMDLSEIEINENFSTKLNGTWAFYPNKLLYTTDAQNRERIGEPHYVTVPATWDDDVEQSMGIQQGTYQLHILKKDDVSQLFGLIVPGSLSPYELYVNGVRVGGLGDMTAQSAAAPMGRSMTYFFALDHADNEIVIQGMNSNPYVENGLAKAIIFGDKDSIEHTMLLSVVTKAAVFAVLMLYFLFAILLFVTGFREKTIIYFALLVLATALTVVITHNGLLFTVVPMNWTLGYKLYFFSLIAASVLFILYIQSIITFHAKTKIISIIVFSYLVYAIFLIVMPIKVIFNSSIIFNIFFFAYPFIVIALILYLVFKGQPNTIFLLLTATALASNSFAVILNWNNDYPIHYPFDILIACTALAAFWFVRHFQMMLHSRELSEKLQRENDRKDDFLANTSHELRNPLHGMMNIAQVLLDKEKGQLQTENERNLQLLISIGNHMAFVLNDLLDLTKLKEQSLQLQVRSLSIQTVIQGVCDMVRFMVEGKPVEIVIKIEEDLPPVLADENRLVQILFNLLHNAVKFTAEGTVTIRVTSQNNEAIVAIEDTGIGIEPVLQANIFDRYEQQDASMTALGGGLGLGLSICKELVELHGGRLTVASTVGKGAVFTFTLPLSNMEDLDDEPKKNVFLHNRENIIQQLDMVGQYEKEIAQREVNEQERAPITVNKPRVLVVDDDPVNLQLLEQLLEAEQYMVVTVLSGEQALDKLQTEAWDLLITDIMMPKMSGYELVRTVRETLTITELPILVLTARSRREDLLAAFRSGANDYVTKPVDAVELKARVQALIYLRQSIEERLRIEAAWLQAQINPHFFFNILNSIHILSEVDEEKMRDLIEAFSEYLQTSFDFENTEVVVPLDYELNLVRSYLAIEEIRFGDRIEVVWELDDHIHFKLPPLSMQTLVENAIKHGLLPLVEGGTITIQVKDKGNHYWVAISDNGVGFPQKEVLAMLQAQGGVGIPNTNLRLKQLYGVGLQMESRPNEGTTMSFQIPKET